MQHVRSIEPLSREPSQDDAAANELQSFGAAASLWIDGDNITTSSPPPFLPPSMLNHNDYRNAQRTSAGDVSVEAQIPGEIYLCRAERPMLRHFGSYLARDERLCKGREGGSPRV